MDILDDPLGAALREYRERARSGFSSAGLLSVYREHSHVKIKRNAVATREQAGLRFHRRRKS